MATERKSAWSALDGVFGLLSRVGRGLADSLSGNAERAAVFKVAGMIAALDGSVSADETAYLRRTILEQTGESASPRLLEEAEASSRAILDCVNRTAGDGVEATFVREAMAAMRPHLAGFSRQEFKATLVTFISVAMADGEFCGVERSAIKAFSRAYIDEFVRTLASRYGHAKTVSADRSPVHAELLEFEAAVEAPVAALMRDPSDAAANAAVERLVKG